MTRDKVLKLNPRNPLLVFILFLLSSSLFASDVTYDEIIIHSYLMRGFSEGFKPGPNPATASFIMPIALHIRPECRESGKDTFAFLRDEVSSIYQIPYVIGLTSAAMIWDGKRKNLNEVVSADGHLYPIQIYPHSVYGNNLSLKLEAFKFRFNEIAYILDYARSKREVRYGDFELFVETQRIEDNIGGEKWLDKELIIPLNEPTVLVLPTGDQSYFLAIRAYKREVRQFSVGLVGVKLNFFNVSDADPVCGRIVGRGDGFENKHRADASLVYKGYTFLFCSQECMKKFQEDPDRYLKKSRIKYFKKDTCLRNPSYMNIQKIPLHTMESIPSRPSVLVRPAFPEACRKKKIQRVVKAELSVDKTGNIAEVKILEPLQPEFDTATAAALHQWKYEPLMKGGKPTSAAYRIDVHFRLKEKESAAESKIAINGSSKIGSILMKSSDYCKRLEDAALYFICLEEIAETIFPGKHLLLQKVRRLPPEARKDYKPDPIYASIMDTPGVNNSYVYDYQLIRKDGRIIEQRILKEENGNLRHNILAPLKTKRFYIYKPIYGPIGLLDQDSHQFYKYSLLEEDIVDGRAAWILEVKPKILILGKPNYGKIWVDKQDASVLRMEIEAESLAGYERIQADYVSRGITPLIKVELDFGLEKNGLRYPTRLICQEAYSGLLQGLSNVSETKITYQKYKFFTVETETRIKRGGNGADGSHVYIKKRKVPTQ